MTCLFGDSTHSPYGAEFLPMLEEVVATCVELLQLDESTAAARSACDAAADEVERLEQLVADVVGGLPLRPAGSEEASAIHSFAEWTAKAVRERLEFERRAVYTRLQEAAEEQRTAHTERDNLLQRLLGRVQLPSAALQLNWRCRAQETAWARVLYGGPGTLQAHMEPELPEAWQCAPRLKEFASGTVGMPSRRLFARQPRLRQVPLSRFRLVGVEIGPMRNALTLEDRKRITVDVLFESPLVVRVSHRSGESRQWHPVGEDAHTLSSLWKAVKKRATPLIERRARLLSARIAGEDLAGIERARPVVETLLSLVGPAAVEVASRSNPLEFVLKRELPSGQREELFLRKSELLSKISVLTDEHRALFRALGLGTEGSTPASQATTLFPVKSPRPGSMELSGEITRPEAKSAVQAAAVAACK